MNLIRIGIVAGAHVVLIGVIYLMSGVGGGDSQEELALAGANGIVNWSNKGPDQDAPLVTNSGFDSRASDLTGYNAGDARLLAQAETPQISSRQRFEPTRPAQSRAQPLPSAPPQDEGVLKPVGRRPIDAPAPPASIIAQGAASQTIQYTIRSGDSLWAISNRFGISREELQAANPGLSVNIQPGQILQIPKKDGSPAPASASSAGPAPISPVDAKTYTVKSGDVLSKIAASQGVTLSALRAANNLSGDLIKVGQKLVIPKSAAPTPSPVASRRGQGLQIVVKPGENLYVIAERYKVTAKDLILHNNIENPQLITAGQTLFIPSKAAATEAAPPPPAPKPVAPPPVVPAPKPPVNVIPEEKELQLVDEEAILLDEDLIEQPVIQIEE